VLKQSGDGVGDCVILSPPPPANVSVFTEVLDRITGHGDILEPLCRLSCLVVLTHVPFALLATERVDDGVKTSPSSDDGVELLSLSRHFSMMAGMQLLILVMIGSMTSASSRVNSSSRASYRARSSCGLMPCCSSVSVSDMEIPRVDITLTWRWDDIIARE
jgi:hypothetical protein